MTALSLRADRDLAPLLACWSDIGAHGDNSLYRHMCLSAAMLKQDSAFAPNGYGQFLTDGAQTIAKHREAIRGAFNLTDDELDRILAALSFTDTTKLNLSNLSATYLRACLPLTLRLSIPWLLLLTPL